MIKTSDLADALGRGEISKAVGVGATAVSNAVVAGRFPSSWYGAVKALADEKGVDCPMDLFAMRFAATGGE